MSNTEAQLVFKIHGMDCAEEVAALKQMVGPLVGNEDRLVFDILNMKMTVDRSGLELSEDTIIGAVAKTGMNADQWQDVSTGQHEAGWWGRHGRATTTTASGIFGAGGFLTHAWHAGGIGAALGSEGLGLVEHPPWLSVALYLFAIGTGLWQVAPKAWRALLSRRPDINLLMTVAVMGAAGIGEWFEAATVAFLFFGVPPTGVVECRSGTACHRRVDGSRAPDGTRVRARPARSMKCHRKTSPSARSSSCVPVKKFPSMGKWCVEPELSTKPPLPGKVCRFLKASVQKSSLEP